MAPSSIVGHFRWGNGGGSCIVLGAHREDAKASIVTTQVDMDVPKP